MTYINYSKEETQREVIRLAKASASEDWCPQGGWQFPFDFGDGIIAPTYTPIQEMHTWRRQVMLSTIERLVPADQRAATSILDIGGGEGAMSIGLWQIGFRDITMLEARPLNIEKAKFAGNHFHAGIQFKLTTIEDFLQKNDKNYDITLFMGLLYHLLNPFEILKSIGLLTNRHMIIESALAQPRLNGFDNRADYSPSDAGFFVRIDTVLSQTAGLSDFELWPNMAAVKTLVQYAGFNELQLLEGKNPPKDFASNSRMIALASK